jgi:hypothetical protein
MDMKQTTLRKICTAEMCLTDDFHTSNCTYKHDCMLNSDWGFIIVIYDIKTTLVVMPDCLYVLVFLPCAYSKCLMKIL